MCETWLLLEESISLINNLSIDHTYIHNSDMLFYPAKRRPYEGRSFIINKKNQYIATLTIKVKNKTQQEIFFFDKKRIFKGKIYYFLII